MVVTSIEKQNKEKNKYSIFIDYEYHFSLSLSDIEYFKIKLYEEISENTYNYITQTLLYIKAQNVALNFLAYKMRTEKEIYFKLYEKKYSEDIIFKVIDFLKKYKYIDDNKYCESYINESKNLKKKGQYLIKYELLKRGIDENLIYSKFIEMNIDEIEFEYIIEFLRKKIKNFCEIDFKLNKKIFSMLQMKGYKYDTIKTAFDMIKEEYL